MGRFGDSARVYALQPGPFTAAGLPVLGSFLLSSLWALLPGSMLDGVQERRALTAGGDDWPPIKVSFLLSFIPGTCSRLLLSGGRVGMAFGSGGPLFWCPFFYPYIGGPLEGDSVFFGGVWMVGPSGPFPYPLSLVAIPKSTAKKKGPVWAPIFAAVVVLLFLHGFSFMFAVLRFLVCLG